MPKPPHPSHAFVRPGSPLARGALLARSTAVALALPALLACAGEPSPVAWEEAVTLAAPAAPAAPAAGDARHAVLRAGADAPLDAALGAAADSIAGPALGDAACAGSVRLSHATGREWHAAWWERREGGSVALRTARTTDGGATWRAPVTADARDAGREGCERPAPAIAADSITGYVHIVYFMRPVEGDGVWYTHSMDRGATFHSTAGLVYGEEAVRAVVAADGMTVVTAYEIPHTRPMRVGAQLSRDGGHTFVAPFRLSTGSLPASDPRAAAHGRAVTVAWAEPGRLVERRGAFR